MKALPGLLFGLFLAVALFPGAVGQDEKKNESAEKKEKPKKPKFVGGKADLFRHVKKHFATLVDVDESGDAARVTLHIEGQEAESKWQVKPDAEIKIHGWWGRPSQLQTGDRVWVWLAVDRQKKPTSVLMIADEISEQDIHGQPWTVETISENGQLNLKIPNEKRVNPRKVQLAQQGVELKAGEEYFFRTAGERALEVVTEADLESLRNAQRDWLREVWRKEGLPGMITFLHPIGGEMEVFLDHEAIRWGRYLKEGDAVKLQVDGTDRLFEAVVKFAEPWRERTRVKLVSKSGLDQLDLEQGARIHLHVAEPPTEVQASPYPTDIGRLTDKSARVEWFIASIYCPCGIANDRCTGMFYTLASCNINACGAPNDMREIIGPMIDEGLDDKAIYDRIQKERSADLVRPHLLR
ncbi:MAG: hypothetical protein HKN23_14720 [Verrucomicrobiales bacterium]|nr:hypothetical protein [Verrucomicrobiales bacterium]